MNKLLKNNATQNIKSVFNLLLDILYPPKCVFCEKILGFNALNLYCNSCMEEIKYCRNYKTCRICDAPLKSMNLCNLCSNYERNFNRSISVFLYIKKARKSILRYKIMRRKHYSATYAKFMCEDLEIKYTGIGFDFIIPAPISRAQLIKRGFNQSYELAKHISAYTKIPILKNVLVKVKNTKQQKNLNFLQRQINLSKSIKSKKKELSGKVVLLIDDVFTTGATLGECSRILKSIGVSQVYCLTLARTVQNVDTGAL